MIIKVTENQYKRLCLEMAYPTTFNFDEFRACRSFAERVRYCEARLPRIAQGSSRIVYKVDNDKVLKLAKNKKGVAQNKVEERLGNSNYYQCFAEVYECDENWLWIEMEYCTKAKKSDFKKIYGIPFEALCCMMILQSNNSTGRKYNPYSQYKYLVDYVWNGEYNDTQELFYNVQDYIGSEMLGAVADLCRISSWGINSEGYFVLVDYGLDDDVLSKYYGG